MGRGTGVGTSIPLRSCRHLPVKGHEVIRQALRGARDGFFCDVHENGAVYETAARYAIAAGRALDRILLSPQGTRMPGEKRR